MRRALLIAALALWPGLALAQFNGGGGISNSGGVQVNGGVSGNVAAYSNAGTIGPNSGITFSGTTPTVTAGTLSGITTLPGSGNSIDASGNIKASSFFPTANTATYGVRGDGSTTVSIAAGGESVRFGQFSVITGFGSGGSAQRNNSIFTVDTNQSNILSSVSVVNNAAGSAAGSGYYLGNNTSVGEASLLLNSSTNASGNGANSLTLNNAGSLSLATGGTNAITISTGQAVGMPALAASSATQTGTVCWTTGTGNLTVDTTTTCLLSSARFKMAERPLDIGLDAVMRLHPVSYDLRPEFNPTHLGRQVGLIAEEVGKVDDRLIAHTPDGEAQGVRYLQLTAVLVRAVQQQQDEIAALQSCRLRVLGHCWF